MPFMLLEVGLPDNQIAAILPLAANESNAVDATRIDEFRADLKA